MILPKKLRKGKTTYILTKYGSYVNESEYGMAAQKNASSYKELIKAGYKPVMYINKMEI